jgi:hypothetical protein
LALIPTSPLSRVPVVFKCEELTACGCIDDSTQAMAWSSSTLVPFSIAARSQQAPEAWATGVAATNKMANRLRMAVYLGWRRNSRFPVMGSASESGRPALGRRTGVRPWALISYATAPARLAVFCRACAKIWRLASSRSSARWTQAVVKWSRLNCGFGWRLRGERCNASSSSYCGRQIAAVCRGESESRSSRQVCTCLKSDRQRCLLQRPTKRMRLSGPACEISANDCPRRDRSTRLREWIHINRRLGESRPETASIFDWRDLARKP